MDITKYVSFLEKIKAMKPAEKLDFLIEGPTVKTISITFESGAYEVYSGGIPQKGTTFGAVKRVLRDYLNVTGVKVSLKT